MEHVHVCLVSGQPIPNLTTTIQFAPNLAVLLFTDGKEREKIRLEKVIRGHGVKTEAYKIEAFDMENVMATCGSVIARHSDARITLNITGGTKIETLGAYQVFMSRRKAIYYVDTDNGVIIQLHPEESRQPITATIGALEYLAAYGFKARASRGWVGIEREIERRKNVTALLAAMAVESPATIRHINREVARQGAKAARLVLDIGCDAGLLHLAEELKAAGLAALSGDELCVYDRRVIAYLGGGWFEEHIYAVARTIGGVEALLNVEGAWDTAAQAPPENEFDVLLCKRNRLYLVSCKTANPNRRHGEAESVGKEYLYELDSLGDRALGLFGKRLLASALPIGDRYVCERARMIGGFILASLTVIGFALIGYFDSVQILFNMSAYLLILLVAAFPLIFLNIISRRLEAKVDQKTK